MTLLVHTLSPWHLPAPAAQLAGTGHAIGVTLHHFNRALGLRAAATTAWKPRICGASRWMALSEASRCSGFRRSQAWRACQVSQIGQVRRNPGGVGLHPFFVTRVVVAHPGDGGEDDATGARPGGLAQVVVLAAVNPPDLPEDTEAVLAWSTRGRGVVDPSLAAAAGKVAPRGPKIPPIGDR